MIDCGKCISKNKTCCTDYSHFITLGDLKRIRALGKSDFAEFSALTENDRKTDLYQQEIHDYYYNLTKGGKLLQLRKGKRDRCLFLGHDNLCGVYAARPLICRMYPFWYEKKKGKISLIIDNNGLECDAVCMHDDPHRELLMKNKKLFANLTKLAKQLDREMEGYKRAGADDIRKLLIGQGKKPKARKS